MDAPQRSKWLLPVLSLQTFACVFGAIPGIWAMAVSSRFAETGEAPLVLFVAMIWALPLLSILGVVLGWIGLSRSRYARAREGMLLAAVPVTAEIAATALAMRIMWWI